MVIVVPTLSHREQGGEADVPALNGGAPDLADELTMVVRQVADQLATEDPRRNTRTDAPPHECPTAGSIEQERTR